MDRRKHPGRRSCDDLESMLEETRRLRFELAAAQLAIRKLNDKVAWLEKGGTTWGRERRRSAILY